ncbi:MAG: Kazal-type serine protease inhibitor family protein [Acidobacteriota bacterium]
MQISERKSVSARLVLVGFCLVLALSGAAQVWAECPEDGETLCLLDDRLQAKVRFKNQHDGGTEGRGTPVTLTDETGMFWFFNDQNFEVVLKAIDGRASNGKVWVFLGSLSDVEYWVDVFDTVTETPRTYYNPPGNRYGIADTNAFDSEVTVCGTIAGLACEGGDFCEFPAGMCNVADLGGVCLPIPDACIEIFDPVCGCDGVTYGNDCIRQQAGVSLDRVGPC